MDFNSIIGLLGTLMTTYDVGKGIFAWITKKRKNRECEIRWDSSDEATQRFIDAVRSLLSSDYQEYIFTDNEIQSITRDFLKDHATLSLTEKDICVIKTGIKDVFTKYNEFTRKQMSLGERIIHDELTNIEEKLGKSNIDNKNQFLSAVEKSKTIGLGNIESFINGDYSIDRSAILKEIRSKESQFVFIVGSPGSGKSVLAKQLVENEKYVLYISADSFIHKNSLSDLWNFDPESMIDYLKDDRCFIFIDAMEYMADSKNDKWMLIQELYHLAERHSNIHIITTCRTEDQSSILLRLRRKHEIYIYELQDLTNIEVTAIAAKYPIVRKLSDQREYSVLLGSPFYINLIVSKMPNEMNMQDENSFRQEIWNRVICLEDKSKEYGISSEKIREAVEYITFERAKRFDTGIHYTEIKKELLTVLISEGIVIKKEDLIRLKYDIYEDICFENQFDKLFDACRGEFVQFFENATKLGRCVYRRYQIWISNKLFNKENRDKFVYKLLEENAISAIWKEQTEIGIVKSKYCADFFEEYFQELLSANKLEEFLQIINLYAFEPNIINNKEQDILFLQTKPIGRARNVIINLVFHNWENINERTNKKLIIALCSDYARQSQKDADVSFATCRIIQKYIELIIGEAKDDPYAYYHIEHEIISLLNVLYQLADVCTEWIKQFWDCLLREIGNTKSNKRRAAIAIANDTLMNTTLTLIHELPEELCQLASGLWLKPEQTEMAMYFGDDEYDESSRYGLSNSASDFNFNNKRNADFIFLRGLLLCKFEIGFPWAIDFINHTMEHYAKNNNSDISAIEICFFETGKRKRYYATPNMWFIGIEEYWCPLLISDIIYNLKNIIVATIRECFSKGNREVAIRFADYIKEEIYSKANNIALLTIIEAVGLNFQQELPGFAVDLTSSIILIQLDIQRIVSCVQHPAKRLLEHQIQQILCLPSWEKRYELDQNCNVSLQEYMLGQQINAKAGNNSLVFQKCIQILDYLYSTVENKGPHAQDYLQIQKMDSRNAKISAINENIYEVEPVISGEAEKIVERNMEDKRTSPIYRIQLMMQSQEKAFSKPDGQPDYEMINSALDVIIGGWQNDIERISCENVMVQLIAVALNNKELDLQHREHYCKAWIDGLERLLHQGAFAAENKSLDILFQQLECNIDEQLKNRIKRIMLEALLFTQINGLINQITKQVHFYLQKHKPLAKLFFNTIVLLAEDEMNHQVYNAQYAERHSEIHDYIFVPNGQPKLTGIDYRIRKNGEEQYKTNRTDIIKHYLYQEEIAQIDTSDIDKFDVGILSALPNCGLNLEDEQFKSIVRALLLKMIELWNSDKRNGSTYDIFGSHGIHVIAVFFREELTYGGDEAYAAINTLFDEIPFENFKPETVDFYLEIYETLGAQYFDAYEDQKKRKYIEKILHYTEEKIGLINPETIRVQLYKLLIFALTRYGYSDWNKYKTEYTYNNKMFLNEQFTKYGIYHLNDVIFTIYMFHVDKLMPEIILSLSTCFEKQFTEERLKMQSDLQEVMTYVDHIILTAYEFFGDEIKRDDEMARAFERILIILVHMNHSKAAVLLDAFRVH